jgi:hypothetical protein
MKEPKSDESQNSKNPSHATQETKPIGQQLWPEASLCLALWAPRVICTEANYLPFVGPCVILQQTVGSNHSARSSWSPFTKAPPRSLFQRNFSSHAIPIPQDPNPPPRLPVAVAEHRIGRFVPLGYCLGSNRRSRGVFFVRRRRGRSDSNPGEECVVEKGRGGWRTRGAGEERCGCGR